MQLCSFLVMFWYWQMYARLIFIIFGQDIPIVLKYTHMKETRRIYSFRIQGPTSRLMMAAYV